MGESTFQATSATTPSSSRLTFASIVSTVLKNLEKDSKWFPNEDIEYYVLQCFDLMSEQTGVVKTFNEQQTVSGTQTYDKPANLIAITSVSYDYFDLIKQEKEKILKLYNASQTPSTVTGMPNAWFDNSITQIGLFPTPQDIKTLRIYYYTYQEDLSDEETPVFLRSVNSIAENYATYMLLARDKENTSFGMYKNMYDEGMRKFLILQKSTPQYMESSEFYDDLGPDDKRMG